ncbi:MAG: asparagine synthetase B, partial [Deltaproteobacteria bacterium]|nr:asparagine synthetase B [Deltaproteobacteria bacterium]
RYGGFSDKDKQDLLDPGFARTHSFGNTRELCRSVIRQAGPASRLSRMIYADTRLWLPDSHLAMADKVSMSQGMEIRSPLLDYTLVEAAARMPDRAKVGLFHTKRALRRAFSRRLPKPLVARKKRGFSTPMDRWLKNPRGGLSQVLLAKDARIRGILQPKALETLLARHQAGRGDYSAHLFTLVTLEMWMRRYLG